MELTEKEISTRIEGLGREQAAQVVCALIGHSRIVKWSFGFVICARCNVQIGDALGSAFDLEQHVIKNHDCDHCRTNWGALTWRDKILVNYAGPRA